MQKWNDETVMPAGKYPGKKLKDIPAHWFVFMCDIFGVDRKSPLGIYIDENIDAIRKRNEKEQKDWKRQQKLNRQ